MIFEVKQFSCLHKTTVHNIFVFHGKITNNTQRNTPWVENLNPNLKTRKIIIIWNRSIWISDPRFIDERDSCDIWNKVALDNLSDEIKALIDTNE